MWVQVGNFAKNTGTGVPFDESVTGLPGTPQAVIMIATNGITNDTAAATLRMCMGMATSSLAAQQGSVACHSTDAAATMVCKRRASQNLLIMTNASGAEVFKLTLKTFDANGFTYTYGTNNTTAYLIGWMAIGGISAAKLVTWAMPTSTGTNAVTGVGFTPDALIHIHSGEGLTAFDTATAHSSFNVSTMDKYGNSNSASMFSTDAVADSDTQRSHTANMCGVNGSAYNLLAAYTSMDSDGFTLNFSDAPADAAKVFTLAIAGGGDYLSGGRYDKTTGAATAIQTLSTPRFNPKGVIQFGDQNTNQFLDAAQATARFGIGLSDGTNEVSIHGNDDNAAATSNSGVITRTDKAYTKVNNGTETIEAVGDVVLGNKAFDMSWTTNDAVGTQIAYLALGKKIHGLPLIGSGR